MNYRTIAQLKTASDFRQYLDEHGIHLEFDDQRTSGPESPLAQPYLLRDGFVIGNRFCTHPMEGWDGTQDGRPTELTFRRWRHFGESGAKLIWGGEAVAVRKDGRANPNQLIIHESTLPDLIKLRNTIVQAHETRHGNSKDLLIGLQLTHSGRFSRPSRKDLPEPIIVYHHPYLDQKLGIPNDYPVISDEELEILIQDFIRAACLANQAGFDFVDIKHCHGYLAHELLSAISRPGNFGGSLENRTRFLRQIVAGIRKTCPELRIGIRLSAFDTVPFEKEPVSKVGQPVKPYHYPYAFGANPANALDIDLTETTCFLNLLEKLGIELVNLTAGSPYYNPHIQRPAYFPPSDGYSPPEDPLMGVARQIHAVAELKKLFPKLLMVGTAYTYLQEWLPNVAQYYVRNQMVDFIGLGRMLLCYPEFPADVLSGKPLNRKRICRTFSDCTTAPRKGLVSGCYPLDPFYKSLPEAKELEKFKKAL